MSNLQEVDNCNDCPFTQESQGHGASLTFCCATGGPAPGSYGSLLDWNREEGLVTPDWCPLPVMVKRS